MDKKIICKDSEQKKDIYNYSDDVSCIHEVVYMCNINFIIIRDHCITCMCVRGVWTIGLRKPPWIINMFTQFHLDFLL